METEVLSNIQVAVRRQPGQSQDVSTGRPFVEANTVESSLEEIRESHIIPVFIKDNEPVISQTDFIDVTREVISDVFPGELILQPNIRLSHPIKGRIPDAKDKPACALFDHEKTLYYERMAFVIELPGISETIDGSRLSLTIGGVKAHNLDNLYTKKGSDEHFKIFIGFKNSVCTNMCVWSDGYMGDLSVQSLGQLKGAIRNLAEKYNPRFHLFHLNKLLEYSITEKQFALVIGRCRMYNHMPHEIRNGINPLLLSDTQIGTIVKDYYRDNSFCRGEDGNINLWRLYNLFTGANKTSYIDTFLDRSVNAHSFIEHLRYGLESKDSIWYLS